LPAPIVNGGGDRFGNVQFSELQKPVTLTLDRVMQHTAMHHSSTSIYTPNFIEIGQTFCGWTDVRTDRRTYWQTFQTPANVIRSTRKEST